jgi:hypothetical protein
MNAETKIEGAPLLAKLREPFPPNQISKLPKETRQQIDARKGDNGRSVMLFNCKVCGGHHHKDAVHLDYVGHAALTDRLLDTDIEWSWEPVGFTTEGLPALDRNGGLWIKLTVCGVTRYGYGAADGKSGGDAMKEMIGDALRNAAMRFGAALDLWHKGDLHVEDDGGAASKPEAANDPRSRGSGKDAPFPAGPAKNRTELKTMGREYWRDVEGAGDADSLDIVLDTNRELHAQIGADLPSWLSGGERNGEAFEGLDAVIERKRAEFANEGWKSNPVLAG